MFTARITNVMVGSMIGLGFLYLGGDSDWLVPAAVTSAVLVATYVVKVKTMWRQAPISAAVVIAAGISAHSYDQGLAVGVHKMLEVVFGCLVGVLVSLVMSKLWLVRPATS